MFIIVLTADAFANIQGRKVCALMLLRQISNDEIIKGSLLRSLPFL